MTAQTPTALHGHGDPPEHDHGHSHGHDHDHGHAGALHSQAPVAEAQSVGKGAVVLDIGGDRGALIVHTDPEWAGTEIDITCLSQDLPRTHTGVHNRPKPVGGLICCAVFPSLLEGEYQLYDPAGGPWRTATVTGGNVTTLRLSESTGADKADKADKAASEAQLH